MHLANRNLSTNFSFFQVYSSEQDPCGRSARQARWRLEEETKLAVRCTSLRRILAVVRASIAPREVYARNKLYFRDEIICINEQKAVLWIESVAAPRHATQVSRHDEGALEAWRREAAL